MKSTPAHWFNWFYLGVALLTLVAGVTLFVSFRRRGARTTDLAGVTRFLAALLFVLSVLHPVVDGILAVRALSTVEHLGGVGGVMTGVAELFVPFVLGIAVAIPAWWLARSTKLR